MATIIHKTVNAFRNPVKQDIGGADYSESSQRVGVPEDIYAIAIAPDSQVDMVRLCPQGMGDANTSIIVSVDAPFIGHISKEQVQHLIAVPIRAAAVPDGVSTVEGVPVSHYPRLKLACYTKREPNWLPQSRAPGYTQRQVTGSTAVVKVVVNMMGRRRKGGFSYVASNLAGAAAARAQLTFYGHTCRDDGTIETITKTYLPGDVAADQGHSVWHCPDGAVGSGAAQLHDGLTEWTYALLEHWPHDGAGTLTGAMDSRIIGGAW